MPVIMFRALEGWCDRLQVLSHCFKYCSQYNTAICVDWDDVVWGGGEFDFNDCFEIVGGIKTMTKKQVCLLAASGRCDIRPKCWNAEKMWSPLRTETFQKDHQGEFMEFEFQKCPGDILVTNGNGNRTWDMREIVKHLRFKPAVMEGIQERLKDFDPNSCVVHLRGTDRPDEKGNYMEKSAEAVKDLPYQIFVVTDDPKLWKRFHELVPRAKLVNPNAILLRIPTPEGRGTHQQDPKDLKKLGVKKWDMMLDLLADWVALVSARQACGRSESTYFEMARRLNQRGEPEWSKVFGGWVPYSKSIAEYNETLLLSHREQTEVQQGVGVPVSEAQDIC